MQAILTAAFNGIFIYAIIMLIFFDKKSIMKKRFQKYFKRVHIDEVQYQVLKEKHENSKKKRSHKFQAASKEFSNYLAMSGVKLSAAEYIRLWIFATFIPMIIVLFLKANIITVLGVGFIGFVISPLFIRRSRKKRQEEFNKQLGESLVIMGNCIKAGFSFQQAMESISSDMQPPISTEFAKVLREIHYGISLEDALKHMVDRVKSKDLDLLVSAVLISAEVGGNLSNILDVISNTIKDRIKIKEEVRVLTSSGRTSGLIIGLLPVFIILILMLINPEYFCSFFESSIGKIMLVVSVILEALGFFIINKIVDIKY